MQKRGRHWIASEKGAACVQLGGVGVEGRTLGAQAGECSLRKGEGNLCTVCRIGGMCSVVASE